VDFVAASFVRSKDDVITLRKFLDYYGGHSIKIIAKIENIEGVENFDEILDNADGIMVARGDMGVEIPFENLPTIQKKLITKCRLLGKRVITATEMLESMITNSRPTRAEISDIANAVYDGTSAIMLSGETAAGKYPVQAVETMAKIAKTTEANINYKKRFHNADFQIRNMTDAISHSTCGMAIDIDAKAIVACSLSGMTARMVSRFRSPVPIVGLTTNETTWRKLALCWGVIPAMCENFTSTDVLFYTAKKIATSVLKLNKKDRIVITGGDTTGHSGNTNMIKVDEI
jgi:pyruvate kinase